MTWFTIAVLIRFGLSMVMLAAMIRWARQRRRAEELWNRMFRTHDRLMRTPPSEWVDE